TRGFSAIIALFLTGAVGLYLWQTRRRESDASDAFHVSEADIERHLVMLDDARDFFAGSLKAADTFRLVASRVGELVDLSGLSLLLLDEAGEDFTVAETEGAVAQAKGTRRGIAVGAAGECLRERDVIVDTSTLSAAIPLRRDVDVYGVLLFEFDSEETLNSVDASTLEAVGERVSPLILSSLAFERSHANALTDVTTDLPNERAFHLILENQVAESVRKGSSRPLTILAFDVRDFDEIAAKYGHSTADRLLNFVAQNVKITLRQMDFFARAHADEFLAIMPTASKEISHEIIARIQTGFFGRKVKVSDTDAVEIELNFGWASFGADGETPTSLLATARERKEQSRAAMPGRVLWFPQEHAH
ncbi:MAG TPA: GGDEF domain-containing protein, partial [Pyrinomonadaceae bacterium]|nr:GGDEF domain-containing protein [Pyrinomonadaceae bacterium]